MLAAIATVYSQEETNVGLLKVADVQYPRQVAPSGQFSIRIDVEYAIRFEAEVKAAMYEGRIERLGDQLWQSDPATLSGGGEMIWNVPLTAPPTEQRWALTILAMYWEGGRWNYYNDTEHGPGYFELDLKIAPTASLEIVLGYAHLPVTVYSTTSETSEIGSVRFEFPVGRELWITVPEVFEVDASTRLLFVGWEDGVNATERPIILDGDTLLVGTYRTQYLLQVRSAVSAYELNEWQNEGSTVTLEVDSSVPMSSFLGTLGFRYVFKGWSGDVESSARAVNVTMNGPKTVTAEFAIDYTPIVIPSILASGIAGGAALSYIRKRRASSAAAEAEGAGGKPSLCPDCGEPVEEDWSHCVHCGRDLLEPPPEKS